MPPSAPSSVGTQFNTHYWDRVALIEARREQYFGQLADVMSMPKTWVKLLRSTITSLCLMPRTLTIRVLMLQVLHLIDSLVCSYPSATFCFNASKGSFVAAINDNIDTTVSATTGADDSAGTGFATHPCYTFWLTLTAKVLKCY